MPKDRVTLTIHNAEDEGDTFIQLSDATLKQIETCRYTEDETIQDIIARLTEQGDCNEDWTSAL